VTLGAFFNHWWNLPFLVMLGLVGVFFVLQLAGLAFHSDADVDGDADADADGDHDGDADGDHDGAWHGVAVFFGVGRVPFMVVWLTFFIFAGFVGLAFNRVVSLRGSYPGWAFAAALLASLVAGAVAVRLTSRLAARFFDLSARGSVRKHELCGRVGIVASAIVDDKFGEVRVRDQAGNELLVHGRVAAGDAPLVRGAKLVLIDYDADHELFWVASVPELDKPN
jgi:membrane protein implicated in regulation of membrane protease activity